MAKISQFSAPGNLKDFGAAMATSWSDKISGFLDAEITTLSTNSGLQPQFYNASKLDVSGTPTPISWPGFPQIIELNFGDDPPKMFAQAEIRDNQDEYLEWAVASESGKITKVMFTCEGPEYWNHLAKDKTLLLKLYSDIVGHDIPPTQILSQSGKYLPRNPFNMQHAIHLIQTANTLQAEIDIASQATIIRRNGASDPIVDANELINCSRFGIADRHSDPHIGDVVNGAARQGCSITLQDPIGLYIESLPHPTNDLGIKKPGGGVVGMEYWKPQTRGDKDHVLRAVFEAPAGQPAVGDLEIGGQKITFGGQIVKAGTGLRVKLTGVVGKASVFHNHSFACPGAAPFAFAAVAGPGSIGVGRRTSRRI
jgi:hypothetical protein